MRITVCELPDDNSDFVQTWESLVQYTHKNLSRLCLLPEMAFSPWFAVNQAFDLDIWTKVVMSHNLWFDRIQELAPAVVLGTRPIQINGYRYNEAFVWDEKLGYQPVHKKYYLPDEPGYWEAHWYSKGDGSFLPIQTVVGTVGFTICTELWALDRSHKYGKAGVQILAVPRATGPNSADKWLAGGRAAAVVAGAFNISSNRRDNIQFDGGGWVVDPDGRVLGATSKAEPYITVDINLEEANISKSTYPCYVF